MSAEVFEMLCTLRETLLALGMDSVLQALENGDEDAAEQALEALLAAE